MGPAGEFGGIGFSLRLPEQVKRADPFELEDPTESASEARQTDVFTVCPSRQVAPTNISCAIQHLITLHQQNFITVH